MGSGGLRCDERGGPGTSADTRSRRSGGGKSEAEPGARALRAKARPAAVKTVSGPRRKKVLWAGAAPEKRNEVMRKKGRRLSAFSGSGPGAPTFIGSVKQKGGLLFVKKLHTPTAIGTVQLKNRMVMAPMVDGFSVDGVPSQRSLDFFRVRAAGGVGLIVVGNIHVDPTHRHVLPECNLYEDSFVEKIRPLVEVIHAGGAKTFAQLIHQGRYARSSEYVGQVQAVAPSAVFTRFTGETPRELTTEEIAVLVGYYAAAARRAVAAGFDGIEICANSGYLPGQFLSPLTNLRTDRYGGSPEARMTFIREVIAAVREQVGDGVPITVRMGGSDFVPGSNTNEDACRIAAELEKAGVNAISVTGGWHESSVPQVTMDLPHGCVWLSGCEYQTGGEHPRYHEQPHEHRCRGGIGGTGGRGSDRHGPSDAGRSRGPQQVRAGKIRRNQTMHWLQSGVPGQLHEWEAHRLPGQRRVRPGERARRCRGAAAHAVQSACAETHFGCRRRRGGDGVFPRGRAERAFRHGLGVRRAQRRPDGGDFGAARPA